MRAESPAGVRWSALRARVGGRQQPSQQMLLTAYSLSIGYGVAASLGFAYWLIAAHLYTPEVVGASSAVLSLMILVAGIGQLGIPGVLSRFVPTSGGRTRRLVFSAYGLASAVTAGIAAGVVAVIGRVSSSDVAVIGGGWWWPAAFVAGCVAWLLFAMQDVVLGSVRRAHWVVVEQLAYSVAKIVLLVALAGIGSVAAVYASWIAPVVPAVAAVTLALERRFLRDHASRTAGQWVQVQRSALVRAGAGNLLGGSFQLASFTILPLAVALELGSAQAAYFYVPWAIFNGIAGLVSSMGVALTVEAAADPARVRAYLRRLVLNGLRLTVPAVALLLGLAPALLGALGDDYADAGAPTLRFLAVALVPQLVLGLCLAAARALDRNGLVALGPAVQFIAAVALGIPLLHREGIAGLAAAWLVGTVLAAAVVAIATNRAAHRKEVADG